MALIADQGWFAKHSVDEAHRGFVIAIITQELEPGAREALNQN